ncbi:hypothetical protein DRO59_02195 [Candidatus Bathyarchaeota archaeon]|nr:MAG: hypothetical protein DRO59_02195 [Candidatus Bathyarchaeota archaeon]
MEEKGKLYIKVNDESLESYLADYVSCDVKFKPLRVSVHFGAKLLKSVVGLIKGMRAQSGKARKG